MGSKPIRGTTFSSHQNGPTNSDGGAASYLEGFDFNPAGGINPVQPTPTAAALLSSVVGKL